MRSDRILINTVQVLQVDVRSATKQQRHSQSRIPLPLNYSYLSPSHCYHIPNFTHVYCSPFISTTKVTALWMLYANMYSGTGTTPQDMLNGSILWQQ